MGMMIKLMQSLSLMALMLIAGPAMAVDEAPLPRERAAPPPALRTVEERLRELLKKELPDAKVEAVDAGLTARFDTLTFTLHNRDMTGRIAREVHTEEGLNNKGILLTLTVDQGKEYHGQAAVPQTLREPYWQTYLNAYPLADGDQHLWLVLEYGGRVDEKLVKKIDALIAEATKAAAP